MIEKILNVKALRHHLPGLMEELRERGDQPKLPISSLPTLNKKIWGLKEGLTVLGARTSQGKSSFAAQIAYDLANQGVPVLFLSLEMTVQNILERLACNVMKIDNYDLLRGRYSREPEIQDKLSLFSEIIERIPLTVTDGIGSDFSDIIDMIRLREESGNPFKVIFVDYIQAISNKSRESRELINEYIRKFRELCLENKIAGVLCSQINRTASKDSSNHPFMHQLKETGSLEELADTVILLHWESFYTHTESSKYKVIISKQRNGRTGEFEINFYPEFYRFEEDLEPTQEAIVEKAYTLFGDRS